jgi:hypothetical protein
LVDRFFRDQTGYITEKSFASLGELLDSIIAFLAERNKKRAKGEDILRKVAAARRALAATAPA